MTRWTILGAAACVCAVMMTCMACTSTLGTVRMENSTRQSTEAELYKRQNSETDRKKDSRMLAKAADVVLESETTAEACRRIGESVTDIQGAYMVNRTNTSVVVRVPADQLQAFVDGLSAYGEVVERSINAVDVTESYYDIDLRLTNAKRMRETYLAILAKAVTVDEILKVEHELQRLALEIDQLTARLQTIGKSVDLATISVFAREPVKPGPLGYVVVGIYKGIKWLFVWD